MDLKLLKMRCKVTKQHHVMFLELYSVSLLLCIAQNVGFEIPYKVLYFEMPFLMIFKYYAWVSCGAKHAAWDSRVQMCIENCIPEMPLSRQLLQIIGRNKFSIRFESLCWILRVSSRTRMSQNQAKSNYKDCSFGNRDSFVKGTRLRRG